jgi:hypothetical protein
MADLKLNSSGGGSVTLTTPSTASNLTLTLPSASGTVATTTGTLTNPTINGFTGDTSVVNIGSGQFYKDASGNVGIGTSSPATLLHVAGSSGLTLGAVSGNAWRTAAIVPIDEGASYKGTLAFYTHASAGSPGAPTERMRLDSAGNLGLGVTPSAWGSGFRALQIGSGASVVCDGSATVRLYANAYYDGTNLKYINSAQASQYRQFNGQHDWWIAGSGSAGGTISFTQAMTLDASGCLGIGPGGTSPSSYGWFTAIGSPITRPLTALYSNAASDSAYPCIQIGKYANDSTTANIYVRFFYNNLTNGGGQINANGAGAAAFGSFSDARLKENITSLPDQLANICALKPSEFDFKDGSGHQIGFIAQEMEEVYPDCVDEDENGMLMISGWSKTEARLVKAVQELSAQNQKLEARLAQLEAK